MKPGLLVVFGITLPTIAASLLALPVDARTQPAALQTEQEACSGIPSGQDVFSVGEVRTSILRPGEFERLNGSEWVLMDGRQLTVQTELSPHLLPDAAEHADSTSAVANDGETRDVRPKEIPDARGRFLRMANNGACADLRGDDGEYRRCISHHDPEGDRWPGNLQADALGRHNHDYDDVVWSSLPENGCPECDVDLSDVGEVGLYNHDNSRLTDHNNSGAQWRRETQEHGRDETRPRNIAVNFYIKICNCRTSNCR